MDWLQKLADTMILGFGYETEAGRSRTFVIALGLLALWVRF